MFVKLKTKPGQFGKNNTRCAGTAQIQAVAVERTKFLNGWLKVLSLLYTHQLISILYI